MLFLIPLVNLVVLVLLAIALAGRFGKGVGYGIGLIIPLVNIVLLAMLAFGSAQFQGGGAAGVPAPAAA